MNKTSETQLIKSMEHYLNEEDRNETIYHRKNEAISSRLQQVIEDATILIAKLDDVYFELPEYQLLNRVLLEQTETDTKGNIIPKDKKNITLSSLQNPSDPDATYRSKSRKANKGYV